LRRVRSWFRRRSRTACRSSRRRTPARDLIQDGRNGFVVAPASVEALAEKMQWCTTHPGELSNMRQAALETAQAWTWDRFRQTFRHNIRTAFGPGAADTLPLSA
jgi:hypothetical protein